MEVPYQAGIILRGYSGRFIVVSFSQCRSTFMLLINRAIYRWVDFLRWFFQSPFVPDDFSFRHLGMQA
jgi:hypothetical protein